MLRQFGYDTAVAEAELTQLVHMQMLHKEDRDRLTAELAQQEFDLRVSTATLGGEKTPWWKNESMLELSPVLGFLCIAVGSLAAMFAVLADVHVAIYGLGGSFLVIVGTAFLVTNSSVNEDKEFFGDR